MKTDLKRETFGMQEFPDDALRDIADFLVENRAQVVYESSTVVFDFEYNRYIGVVYFSEVD